MRSDSTPTLPTFRAAPVPKKSIAKIQAHDLPSVFLMLRPTESGIFCEAGEDCFGPIQAFQMVHQSKNGSGVLFYAVLLKKDLTRLYSVRITRVGEREHVKDDERIFHPVYFVLMESVQDQTASAFPLFHHLPAPLRIPLEFSPSFELRGSRAGLEIVNLKSRMESYGPYPMIQSISIMDDHLNILINPFPNSL